MINEAKLKLYLNNGVNVLLEGAHGVGKTSVVKKIFEESGLKWKYYSAATMDPWVDFIGVPKTVATENGEQYLELIKPKELALDEVEVMFFDEFNRAPEKVVNAVMELIQFRSINGKKFNNLKAVWAAINPYDEENTYTVINLDPAVMDRFPIKIKVPYELDSGYLYKKHGDLAKPFIQWWNKLSPALKKEVSPRRIDYSLWIYSIGGDLNDVLPKQTNPQALISLINDLFLQNKLEEIKKMSDDEKKKFFTLENTMKYADDIVSIDKTSIKFFNKEFIEQTIQDETTSKIKKELIKYAMTDEKFLGDLSKASKDIVAKEVNKMAHKKQELIDSVSLKIDSLVSNSVGFDRKTFFNRLAKGIVPILKEEKIMKMNFRNIFDWILDSKDINGNKNKEKIIKILEQPFKNMSQSLPNENYHLLAGMLYGHILKKEDNQKLNQFVVDFLRVAKKNRKQVGTVKGHMFALGLSKDNESLLDSFNSSKSNGIYDLDFNTIVATKQAKPFMDEFNNGSDNIFDASLLLRKNIVIDVDVSSGPFDDAIEGNPVDDDHEIPISEEDTFTIEDEIKRQEIDSMVDNPYGRVKSHPYATPYDEVEKPWSWISRKKGIK